MTTWDVAHSISLAVLSSHIILDFLVDIAQIIKGEKIRMEALAEIIVQRTYIISILFQL